MGWGDCCFDVKHQGARVVSCAVRADGDLAETAELVFGIARLDVERVSGQYMFDYFCFIGMAVLMMMVEV